MKCIEHRKHSAKWTKPAYRDLRLGFEYTLYVATK